MKNILKIIVLFSTIAFGSGNSISLQNRNETVIGDTCKKIDTYLSGLVKEKFLWRITHYKGW